MNYVFLVCQIAIALIVMHVILGAVAYVRANTPVIRQTLALVEVDCVGTVASPLRVSFLAWPASHRTEKRAEILGLLRTLPACVVDDLSENPAATTAFYLPGVPSISFIDEYNRLPIHTAQDSIDLMRPEAFARTAAAIPQEPVGPTGF